MNVKKPVISVIIFLLLIIGFFPGLSFSYVYPTNVKTISSDYGPRALRSSPWHKGLDFPMPWYTPVKAIATGDVVYINVDKRPGEKIGDGYAISIYSPDAQYKITYKHLFRFYDTYEDGVSYQYGFITVQDIGTKKPYDLIYKYRYSDSTYVDYYIASANYSKNISFYDNKGEVRTPSLYNINEGEVFAVSDNTGLSFNPHLHIEVYSDVKKSYINPLHDVLPYENIFRLEPSIVYPTLSPGSDSYTPDPGAREIAIRANVNSQGDFDLNKVEFLIDTQNPPRADQIAHYISFDPRENAADNQIFLFNNDPVASTGCYPRGNGDDDFGHRWDLTGRTGDYYVRVKAYDIQGYHNLSDVLHIRLSTRVSILVTDAETGLPVEGATVTLSNTQLAYNDTEITASGTAVAAAAPASFTSSSEPPPPPPPGVAVFEDVSLNTTYNVLIKKQGYQDSDTDGYNLNDSITPTEDGQIITLALKPKPPRIVVLHDTTTIDGGILEYDYASDCHGRAWDTRFQTAQGRFVGYGLEKIKKIYTMNTSLVEFYINGELITGGVWTRKPGEEGYKPMSWKIILNQTSWIGDYGAGLMVETENLTSIRYIIFFPHSHSNVFPYSSVWTRGGSECWYEITIAYTVLSNPIEIISVNNRPFLSCYNFDYPDDPKCLWRWSTHKYVMNRYYYKEWYDRGPVPVDINVVLEPYAVDRALLIELGLDPEPQTILYAVQQ